MSRRMLQGVPRIKVCGLQQPEDVDLALRSGADAVGFVHFAPSVRHLETPAIRALGERVVGSALRVLVVVNIAPAVLAVLVADSGCDAVQLCGDERPEAFQGFPAPILRRVAVEPGAEAQLEAWAPLASAFVLDHPSSPGGSGKRVDPVLAAELASRAPCLLAGGLGPDSVAAAVAAVRPAGVDASSGLERVTGAKSTVRVRAFCTAARAAFDAIPSDATSRH